MTCHCLFERHARSVSARIAWFALSRDALDCRIARCIVTFSGQHHCLRSNSIYLVETSSRLAYSDVALHLCPFKFLEILKAPEMRCAFAFELDQAKDGPFIGQRTHI